MCLSRELYLLKVFNPDKGVPEEMFLCSNCIAKRGLTARVTESISEVIGMATDRKHVCFDCGWKPGDQP